MRRLQVLVASSDYFIKKQLVRNLLCEGHDVWVASEGPGALKLAREVSADIVIADEALRGLSGKDLCRRLRPFPLSIQTPFTFLVTGTHKSANPYESAHLGIDVIVGETDISELIQKRCFRFENLPRSVRSSLVWPPASSTGANVHLAAMSA